MPIVATVLVPPTNTTDGYLPEGPRHMMVQGRPTLVWVNIQHAADQPIGSIRLRDDGTGLCRSIRLHARPGFVFPTDQPDTVLVGVEKEIGLLHLVSESWQPLARIPDEHPETIINDGEIEPGGRAIVFGTKHVRFQETIAHLYRYTIADQRITIIADQQLCSNGKVFGNDARGPVMFDIDTPKKRIDRYRWEGERWQLDGIALDLNHEVAFPDGMVDAGNDCVIVAFFNPHRGGDGVARMYDLRSGETVEEWITPGSPRVTCPLLIERDGRVWLVLTTADEGMPESMRADSPNVGSLFIAETPLTSIPMPEVVRL